MSAEPVENPENESNEDDDFLLMRRRHKGAANLIEGLNLTAMMDMMTIILVFLIKQYASAPENIQMSEVMRPPKSTVEEAVQPTVNVFITQKQILVDDKEVLKVEGGKIVSDKPGNEALVPLNEALQKQVNRINALHDRGGPEFDGALMVVADQETPYDLLYTILQSASRAQFNEYRMIVVANGK